MGRTPDSDGAPTMDRSVRRDLKLITADGMLYCVMVGAGEAYFSAFTLALGFGEVLAGLIATLPMLAGALLQLVSPTMVRRLGSTKRWVVLNAHLQVASFLPLAIAAAMGRMPLWALFASVTLYWATNLATGPAWNTWVTTLVPLRIRARYFGRRTRLTHVGTLAGLIGAGLTLQYASGDGGARPGGSQAIWAYAVLFGAAGLSRLGAARCLAAQSEPVPLPANYRRVTAKELAARWRHGHDARLLTYMLAVQLAVQVSAPFFTSFLLAQVRFTYGEYMVLIATSFVGKMIFVPMIGRAAHAIGPARVLWMGGIGIVPFTAMLAVSHDFWWVLAIQFLSGSCWACYELGTLLLLFETIPDTERTSVLTIFNAGNAMALVTGSIAGGLFLRLMGESTLAYHALFIASSSLRLVTLLLLARVSVPRFEPVPIPLRTISVRPQTGSLSPPVLPGIAPMPEGQEAGSPESLAATGGNPVQQDA